MKKYYIICSVIIALLIQNIQAQNVGIGTTTPIARLHVADSNVLFTGSISAPTSNPPISGAGNRLMWYAPKSAFRVGVVSGAEWDKDNIGIGSFATGFNSKAFGNYSTAINSGISNGLYSSAFQLGTANGDYSTAFGYKTFANGNSTLVMGRFNDSIYTRNLPITNENPILIIGNGTSDLNRTNAMVVEQSGQVGLGTDFPKARLHVNSGNVVFTGTNLALEEPFANIPVSGEGVRMMWYPDKAAFRVGAIFSTPGIPLPVNYWDKTNIGIASFASGFDTKASGEYSTAMGYGSFATGIGSIALGEHTYATGHHSVAAGHYALSSGYHGVAIGDGSDARGDWSVAIGRFPNAIGLGSLAMGYNTSARGLHSTALGYQTTANGAYSSSMGQYTKANGYASLAIGLFNDSIIPSQNTITNSTPLFIVGNGNNFAELSNAFVVLKNGNVAIGDNGNPVNRLHITGGTDASLSSSSGYITTGFISSTNMVIDNNELQVRLNGAASDLYLQNNGGNIAVGNTGVPAYQLELSTNSAGKPGSSSWSIASDSRLKQNINPYTQGLQQLLQINPVTYQYNEKSGFDTKPEYVGIIAQDLQKIAPYMISTVKRKEAEYLSVDNGAMTYMLINAVKEQQQQIELLKAEIELLKKANK
jgi:hypothetical protein